MSSVPWESSPNGSGGAAIGMHGGVNHGVSAAVVHGDVNTYQVSDQATPEQKYAAALEHLKGGMPKKAVTLLADVAAKASPADGEYRAGIGYYWTLSLLSGRIVDELSAVECQAMERALHLPVTGSQTAAGWSLVLAVVRDLVNVHRAGEQRGPDVGALTGKLEALPPERQREIAEHLALIVAGAERDYLDGVNLQAAREEQHSRNRANRVWKFFQPVPLQPMRVPVSMRSITSSMLMSVGGLVLAGLGLILMLPIMATDTLLGTVLILLAAAGSGCAVGMCGIRHVAQQAEHDAGWSWRPRSGPDWLSYAVAGQIEQCLRDVEADRGWWPVWFSYAANLREKLWREIVAAHADLPSPSLVPGIEWLVRWHVEQVHENWIRSDRPLRHQRSGAPLGNAFIGMVVGWVGLGIVSLLGFVILSEGPGMGYLQGMGGGLLLGLGVVLSGLGGLSVKKAYAMRLTENRFADWRLEEERRAYVAWCATIADRPPDKEIAEWLRCDVTCLSDRAIRMYGLTKQEVLRAFVLTEPGAMCRRARDAFGPLRYSRYGVLVFLLTARGVRQVQYYLDLFTGQTIGGEQRMTFRYDTVTSVEVVEVGVQYHGQQRSVMAFNDATKPVFGNNSQGLELARSLRLSLENGQHVDVLVEGVDDGTVEDESRQGIGGQALDAAGITRAWGILEAVAADGQDWMVKQQNRQRSKSDLLSSMTGARRSTTSPSTVEPMGAQAR